MAPNIHLSTQPSRSLKIECMKHKNPCPYIPELMNSLSTILCSYVWRQITLLQKVHSMNVEYEFLNK